MIEELIEKAKNKYPISVSYTGRLTGTEIETLEKYCTVHCPSVYMDGTAEYSIRYRKDDD